LQLATAATIRRSGLPSSTGVDTIGAEWIE
jgi:hypothetical protein